ncbi:ribosomal protein L23, putative [Plasmodium knowlesi strain H]|uniref:Ribosomal protein L23, putative n=3 Tax=Plasmodium knowlesi TaxID=5850 RepID=A0A679L8N2_PLAKH|nr:ribosomal protein L23 [Plasmodium knowlesi strain H]BBB58073.1 large subunit ribosomal protein 23 [Plasmodium knowlesi]CAA9991332.1 ribosomal protein L23, putative [Plasmodium knowlesi strain H]SBO27221.1 ribosomal protein L23, putative [Plasmodium knowlesi strain H]VVS80806.1 ribosomal protein L23, putative [Plasmodium knowlesi strain H]
MKEIILNLYYNYIFYKISFIKNRYYIIYSKIYLTKLDIKYIIKNILKKDYNFNNIKINYVNIKNNYKKYCILIK